MPSSRRAKSCFACIMRARSCVSIAPGGGAGMPGTRRGRDRPRDQHQRIADESRRDRTGILRGKLISPRILVGQLGLDLELDRHQVLAANLARAAGGNERLDAGDLRFAAERGARRGHHAVGGARLRKPGKLSAPRQTKTVATVPRTGTNRRIDAGSLDLDPRNAQIGCRRSFDDTCSNVLRSFYVRSAVLRTGFHCSDEKGRPNVRAASVDRRTGVART